jgi:hypothetical protein
MNTLDTMSMINVVTSLTKNGLPKEIIGHIIEYVMYEQKSVNDYIINSMKKLCDNVSGYAPNICLKCHISPYSTVRPCIICNMTYCRTCVKQECETCMNVLCYFCANVYLTQLQAAWYYDSFCCKANKRKKLGSF